MKTKIPQPIYFLLPMTILLAGCVHAPTIDVFGSYFPAWMVCIVVGIFLTIITRLVLIGLGIHAHLRLKFPTYLAMMVFFTLAVWIVFFKK